MNTEQIKIWVDAAVKDGWIIEPTYPKHEPQEKACSFKKGLFKAMATIRGNKADSINVWTLDDIAVKVPEVYNYEQLVKNIRICDFCGKEDIEPKRMAFANRCCPECRKDPKIIAKHEYRGWCD